MKKLFGVITLVLAINFLAAAGGVGYLVQTHHLDKPRLMAIKDVLFPKPEAPTTQPAVNKPDATTQPVMRLEELLARESGRSAGEQVEFIQHTFDAQMAQLDRRQREVADLRRQVDVAQDQLARDRAAMAKERAALTSSEAKSAALAQDKGFQDSLALFNSMPSKQVKTVFMGLDDPTIVNYLEAMEPRTAAKVVKEFKSPEESARIQKVLEVMRRPDGKKG